MTEKKVLNITDSTGNIITLHDFFISSHYVQEAQISDIILPMVADNLTVTVSVGYIRV